MDEAALRAMMPMGFGKQPGQHKAAQQVSSFAPEHDDDDDDSAGPSTRTKPSAPICTQRGPVGPSLAPGKRPASTQDEENDQDDDDGLTLEERAANRAAMEAADDDDDAEEDDDDEDDLGPEPENGVEGELPISHGAILKDHTKIVSALDVDPSGARVATGGYDYDVKLWDFGGMTSAMRPFKSFEPNGSYFVHDLKWSPAGDTLLVISGTSQAKVYTRDGGDEYVYKKGDVYIRDMKKTSGHVAELSSGDWHPHTVGRFLTASADSSIRLWDVEDRSRQKTVISVKSKERGTRTRVTKAKFSPDGRNIAATCHDGAIHVWATNTNFATPNASVEGAHMRNTDTSGLAWSLDNHTLATRGGPSDDTVKLWDMRNLKKALVAASDVPNLHSETDIIFSLDERTVLTGSAATESSPSTISVFSRTDLSLQRKVAVDEGTGSSVVRLQWHPKINQVFCSTSKGLVHVFYSPNKSSRGALLAVDKAPRRRKDVEDYFESAPGANGSDQMIIVPEDMATGRSAASKRRRLEKERKDPKATRIPELPLNGPGKGGRIGSAATQHMVNGIYKDNSRAEDPREALLKYADKVEKDGPKFMGMYAKTQPKTIFREVGEAEEKRDK